MPHLVVKVVVPIEPVLQGQVGEYIGGLGDEDLSDGVAEGGGGLAVAAVVARGKGGDGGRLVQSGGQPRQGPMAVLEQIHAVCAGI